MATLFVKVAITKRKRISGRQVVVTELLCYSSFDREMKGEQLFSLTFEMETLSIHNCTPSLVVYTNGIRV